MSPVRAAWRDWREAAAAFSPPARRFLLAEFLAWVGHGVFAVLFNLYLVEAGHSESFVGSAISLNGLGLGLAALPAGLLAERWGRARCLILGAALDGAGLAVRAAAPDPGVILGASFVAGAGQSMLAIAAAPFITEHSGARERPHLFSTFFSAALLAGVAGNALGGALPWLAQALPGPLRPTTLGAYRGTLLAGAAIALAAGVVLARLRGLREAPLAREAARAPREATRRLRPIACNFLLIGMGAGLVIPFMNLYFANRFACSSAQIGLWFAGAQVLTAIAGLLAPAAARRFGRLRAATASQLMSLPFLVSLGAEHHLPLAVAAFWLRATLMQASTPLLQNFVMDALPPGLRARSTSLNHLAWNIGWALSATLSGVVIERFGFAVPFYVTAVLYGAAAITFYRAFRSAPEAAAGEAALNEDAKGSRGTSPFTD
uniref:MFS transporter n=1 Tax=Eiseniibacteriota bacterium TaxID=2212470 RepID=A0A832MM50_UNCEI